MIKKILIAGESWVSSTTHIKRFDTSYTSTYEEGMSWLKEALEKGGYEVTFLPNHLAPEKFPFILEEIQQYGGVILSDIGSNTLLLPHATFTRSEKRRPNRCELIKEYVAQSESFCMIGGYMSFTGIEAKARFGETAIADILPVKMLDKDDRVEFPEGLIPETVNEHEILKGIPMKWPYFLGYNKTEEIAEGTVLAKINNDPFITIREYGKGKTAVFTSNCTPYWGSIEFVNWEYYNLLWTNLLNWLTK